MGLKDQLLQKATNKSDEEQSQVVVDEEMNVGIDIDEIFSDDNEDVIPNYSGETVEEEYEELEPEPEPESAQEIDVAEEVDEIFSNEPESFEIPSYSDESNYEPQYNPGPDYTASKVVSTTSSISTPFSTSRGTNDMLEGDLLLLAKKTILEDVTKNFESQLLTSTALENLVSSYLNGKSADYTNSAAIFISVIDEIIDSNNYQHEYYRELVPRILESVKSDLNG